MVNFSNKKRAKSGNGTATPTPKAPPTRAVSGASAESPDSDLPEGFVSLMGGRVDGWFLREESPPEGQPRNSVRGILLESFEVKSRFPDPVTGRKRKTVYKIQITKGVTRATTMGEGDEEARVVELGEGQVVGLDESGWLRRLKDVDDGTEVFVLCKGRGPATEEAPQGAWIFAVGTMGGAPGKAAPGKSNGTRGRDDVPPPSDVDYRRSAR